VAERDGGLLEVEQDAAGALGRDAVVKDGVHDFGERHLDVGERFHARKAGAEDVGAAEDSGDVLAALLIAVVEVAKALAVKGRRTAGGAVRLGEVADAAGHGNLQKSN
jgi:hypothetical protein